MRIFLHPSFHPSVRHAIFSYTTRRNSTKLGTSLSLMVRVCKSSIIFLCVLPSLRSSSHLSVTLSPPKPLGCIQANLLHHSPHGKGVRKQHYFSVCPSVRASVVRPPLCHEISSYTTWRNLTKLATSLFLMIGGCESNIFFRASVVRPFVRHAISF